MASVIGIPGGWGVLGGGSLGSLGVGYPGGVLGGLGGDPGVRAERGGGGTAQINTLVFALS